MKVLYFDCSSGISGEMIFGALMDLGIDLERCKQELSKINLESYELLVEKTIHRGLAATEVKVALPTSDHRHFFSNSDNQHDKKCLLEIEALIENSRLSERVKAMSIETFREIAEMEAGFHDLGLYDLKKQTFCSLESLLYVIGTCISLELLNIERVYSSVVQNEKGMYHFNHAQDRQIHSEGSALKDTKRDESHEILPETITAVGLGIIKTISSYFGIMPQMYIEKIGYGMEKNDQVNFHVMRVCMGSIFEHDTLINDVSIIETNFMDRNLPTTGYLFRS